MEDSGFDKEEVWFLCWKINNSQGKKKSTTLIQGGLELRVLKVGRLHRHDNRDRSWM